MSSNQKRTKVIIYTHFSQTKKNIHIKNFLLYCNDIKTRYKINLYL